MSEAVQGAPTPPPETGSVRRGPERAPARADSFAVGERNRVRRLPRRAAYDRAAVYEILDAGLVAHVAFLHRGEPFAMPMAYGRMGDAIVLHGSRRARILEAIAGERVCVTVTLVDGLVLARSAFHSSMNYRSATVFGRPRVLEDESDKLAALEAFTDRIMPGRWSEVRTPNEQELLATTVVALDIEEAAAKSRSGGPLDDPEDLDRPIWAGVLPLVIAAAAPEPVEASRNRVPPEAVGERVRALAVRSPAAS